MSLLDDLNNINDSDSENDEDYVPAGTSPPPSKKPKLSSEEAAAPAVELDKAKSLDGFVIDRVLNENLASKMIILLGTLSHDADKKPAVAILEKTPFVSSKMADLVKRTSLENLFQNDIYRTYHGYPQEGADNIKVTLIHPATEKHIEKYSPKPLHMVAETPANYAAATKPFIQASANTFSLQWVYNILEHKSEADRIVLEDQDPDIGFVLLPDMKWNQSQLENLYLLAICHRRDLRSLRDLTAEHLPLLRNIRDKATAAIVDKYGISSSRLRTYLHYLPSYYHLHVHFTALSFDAPGAVEESEEDSDAAVASDEDAESKKKKGKKQQKKKKLQATGRKRKGGICLEGGGEEAAEEEESKEEEAEEPQKEKTDEYDKVKADSLWADFLKDVEPPPPKSKSLLSSTSSSSIQESPREPTTESKPCSTTEKEETSPPKKITITQEFDFAGETVHTGGTGYDNHVSHISEFPVHGYRSGSGLTTPYFALQDSSILVLLLPSALLRRD
ncbi:DCPS [Cordylochernes scorpioides]|uniref:m7GpppX diphosphatase n=1 Tax=Cordylochernes scorpioides TaxID=51811 RepID=A0ABY6KEP8_9ARAC|nr:DCPS [Cordylochernes scorpioides]